MVDEIKKALRVNDIRQWQLAQRVGISERTLILWFRAGELTGTRLDRVRAALDALIHEKQKGATADG